MLKDVFKDIKIIESNKNIIIIESINLWINITVCNQIKYKFSE